MFRKQKQPPELFNKKSSSWKFCIIHRKSPFNFCHFITKRLQHRCFPLNIMKFLETPIWGTSAYGCFWGKLFLFQMLAYSASYFVFWFLEKQILSENCLEKSSFIKNKTALLDYLKHFTYPIQTYKTMYERNLRKVITLPCRYNSSMCQGNNYFVMTKK